jgi:hypothetical protein
LILISNIFFFEKDNEILSLDNFRYEQVNEKQKSQIIATFTEGKYLNKRAFVIDIDYTYDIYYNDQKLLRIEPDLYKIGHLGVNGDHDYLFFSLKNKKLNKIPDNFRCEFNGKLIEKSTYEGKEYFEITDIGKYILYKDNNLYHKIYTFKVWEYRIEDVDKDINDDLNIKYY